MLYVFALIGFLSVYGVKISKKHDAQTRVMLQPQQSIFCGEAVNGSTASAANGYGNAAGDVDYSFSLRWGGVVTVDSCESNFDTWLRIFDASGTTQLCGCDDCGPCGLRTVLECELEAGDYIVVVDGYSNREGEYSIQVTCPEPTPPEPIACGSAVSGSTVGVANVYGNAAGDRAYSLVLPTATSVTLDSCGSGFDTYLRVFAVDGSQVCFCDDCGPCGLRTVLECELAAGEYLVVVDGYSTREGEFDVAVRCVVPTEPIGCDSVVSGSTVGLVNGYGNAAGDRAYSLVLPAAASVTLDTCGSGFDTYLRVFAADGAQVCFCDDCGPCGLQTVLECDLAGGEYLVVVDGYSTREGDFNLALSCGASVTCGESFSGSTVGALNVLGNSAGDSLYSFSLDADSVVTLDSCGSNFDTYLRVYDYTLSTQVCGCDDCGACGLQTVLECELGAGDYVIVVDGFSTREGDFDVAVSCAVLPEPIGCDSVVSGSTVGNANNYGNAAGDYAYSLSLARATEITLDSCGSGFDTYLRVFTSDGSTQVCGCDDCGPCGLQTILDCALDAGEYLVVVDGYSTREGDFNLALTCGPSVGCGESVSGSTVGAMNVVGNSAGDSLYSFSLDAPSVVTLDSCGSNFDTYLRVYDNTLSTQVCGCDDCGACGLQTVLVCELGAGDYVIVVDGYSTREGDFAVSVTC